MSSYQSSRTESSWLQEKGTGRWYYPERNENGDIVPRYVEEFYTPDASNSNQDPQNYSTSPPQQLRDSRNNKKKQSSHSRRQTTVDQHRRGSTSSTKPPEFRSEWSQKGSSAEYNSRKKYHKSDGYGTSREDPGYEEASPLEQSNYKSETLSPASTVNSTNYQAPSSRASPPVESSDVLSGGMTGLNVLSGGMTGLNLQDNSHYRVSSYTPGPAAGTGDGHREYTPNITQSRTPSYQPPLVSPEPTGTGYSHTTYMTIQQPSLYGNPGTSHISAPNSFSYMQPHGQQNDPSLSHTPGTSYPAGDQRSPATGYTSPPAQAQASLPTHGRHVTGPEYEALDKSYKVRNTDYKKFFRQGRVFCTLWSDTMGATTKDETFSNRSVTHGRFGQGVHSKIRRFVVVKQYQKNCTCLPITTYDGRGTTKRGITLEEHGQIYSSRRAPERPNGIEKEPLKVILSRSGEELKSNSYVVYGKPYTVEANVKVKDVGELDTSSRRLLRRYYNEINTVDEFSETEANRDTTDDLIGVGTGVGESSESYQSGPYPSEAGSASQAYNAAQAYNPPYTNEQYSQPAPNPAYVTMTEPLAQSTSARGDGGRHYSRGSAATGAIASSHETQSSVAPAEYAQKQPESSSGNTPYSAYDTPSTQYPIDTPIPNEQAQDINTHYTSYVQPPAPSSRPTSSAHRIPARTDRGDDQEPSDEDDPLQSIDDAQALRSQERTANPDQGHRSGRSKHRPRKGDGGKRKKTWFS